MPKLYLAEVGEQSGSGNDGRQKDGYARSHICTLPEGFSLQKYEDPLTVQCLEPESLFAWVTCRFALDSTQSSEETFIRLL